MARASVIFSDEDDGGVNVKIEFDPALKTDREITQAQATAFRALDSIGMCGKAVKSE